MKKLATTLLLSIILVFVPAMAKEPVSTKLKPCPNSPNCVSSLADSDSSAYISPITHDLEQDQAMQMVATVIAGMPRTALVEQSGSWLHFTFKSKLMKFVDDVEFDFSRPGTIHFRSASRVGYSDLGANRERMEEFREAFNRALAARQ